MLHEYPIFKAIGGLVIAIYGFKMPRPKKKEVRLKSGENTNKYLKLFTKGFLINIINVGIFFFWLFIIGWVGKEFPGNTKLKLFIAITLFSYTSFETGKLFFARYIKDRLTDQNLVALHKIIRLAIIIFGIVIIFK